MAATTTKGRKVEKGKVDQRVIDTVGKMPPHDEKIERTVLGAMMIEKNAYFEVSSILTPECFFNDKNRYVYEAIVKLAFAQEPIDMITVAEKLRQLGSYTQMGGYTEGEEYLYLTELTGNITSAVDIYSHAKILASKYIARELIRVSTDIQTRAFDETSDVDELTQSAEGQIFEITQHNIKKDVEPVGSVLSEAIKRIETASKQEGNMSGLPSGFTALDDITNGWQKSTLNVIAARPAMGKTAFVLSMAKNMAVDYNRPIAVFSLEMSNVELTNRLITNVAEIKGDKIKRGNLMNYEWEQLHARTGCLASAPIYLDDTPQLSVFELCTKARRLKREHNIECIIIDYLQLMNASGMQYGSREQEVSIISRSLKALAKELEIPVIALAQLNRGVEQRQGEDKRPQLSDLRESGAIEQDADMVLMIHRPAYYHILQDKNGEPIPEDAADIIIAKHRSGSIGDVRLRFIKDYVKFTNVNAADIQDSGIPSSLRNEAATDFSTYVDDGSSIFN